MIKSNLVDLYYHEWHQIDDVVEVEFKLPDEITYDQVHEQVLSENTCFKAQLNEEYPFFAGLFFSPIASFDKEYSIETRILKFTFKKQENVKWDLIFKGPIADTDVMDPQSLFEHGKHTSNQEEIDKAAKMNFPPALLELTKLNKSEEEIAEIYEKAAEYHDPFALFVTGMFCIRRNELDKAIEKLTEAEKRGDVNSINALGEIYSPLAEPHILGEDVNIALTKFRKVLEIRPNHAYALYNLALLYLNGCGVEQNIPKAREFYDKAKSIDNDIPELDFPGYGSNITKYAIYGFIVLAVAGASIYLIKRQQRKK